MRILTIASMIIALGFALSCKTVTSYSGGHSIVEKKLTPAADDGYRGGPSPAVREEPRQAQGTVVGRVHEVNYNTNEVTVRQTRDLMMGSVVFVVTDAREIMMTVTFPMQSVSKCQVVANQRQFARDIKKDMVVYIR